MLSYKEISQLSNQDLMQALKRARDFLFRQRMGVRTSHLKDSHKVRLLKKHIARLLTENARRRKGGETVAMSEASVLSKLSTINADLAKPVKVKKVKAGSEKEVLKEEGAESKEMPKASSAQVRVKKAPEKKSVFQKFFGKA